MRPRDIRFSLATCCAVLLCSPVVSSAEITVRSVPANMHLQFRGPVSVEGVTPLTVDHLPPGDYLFRATGLGLVTARGRLRSDLDQRVTVQPWARPYALIMPPGFVHLSRRDGWRGGMFTVAAAGGAVGAIVKNAHHDNARADVRLAQDAYDLAITEADVRAARLDLETASDRERDEAKMRNIWIGYTAAAWVGAAIEAWLLTSSPKVRGEGQGSFEVQVDRARPFDAALRSAIVPGSGQRHMGHNWRGIIFGASVFTLGAVAISSYDEYLEARRKQDDAQRRYDAATTTSELDAIRPTLEQSANDASDWKVTVWSFAGAAGAIYVWNILDALGQGAAGWEPKGVDVGLVPRGDGFAASFSWRLP